eukprot:g61160.t1
MAGGRSFASDVISTMKTSGDKAGWTALFDAAENVHVEVAQSLLREECNSSAFANSGIAVEASTTIWY